MLRTLIFYIILTIVLNFTFLYFFQIFFGFGEVDGVSMKPNFHDKQKIFTSIDYYKKNPIKHGDVVLVKIKNKEEPYLKRVVGLPNDRIKMKNGILYLNDKPKTIDKELEMNIYEEKINKFKSFKILNVSKNDEDDNFNEINISEKFYYILGDNREVSVDSRKLGLIQKKNIMHKVLPQTHFVYNFLWFFEIYYRFHKYLFKE